MKPSEALSNIRIEHECSVTINTGNFTNIKPSYAVSADVNPGVNPSEAKEHLRRMVEAWLESHVEKIQRDLNG